MRRGILFLLLASFSLFAFAQQDYRDAFVGTWIYESNDTIFKVRLQKGSVKNVVETYEAVLGGYMLSIKGVVKEAYIKDLPAFWDTSKTSAPSLGIYIIGSHANNTSLGFSFYDMEKKHIYGTGLPCNWMTLLAPDKLHWKLNEREGVWAILEGSENDEDIAEMELRGFSVPDDVIMTKEE